MSTPPEDIDALFDLPPSSPPTSASPMPPASPFGSLSLVGAEGRKEQRVKVSWPGRVQLPNGRVVELRVRDLSESGVGLLSTHHIPPSSVLNFAMGVPGLHEAPRITPVTATIKTTYVVIKGNDLFCGGIWVSLPADARELLDKWMRRLRR
jgi:hypothetical protein